MSTSLGADHRMQVGVGSHVVAISPPSLPMSHSHQNKEEYHGNGTG